MSGSQHVAFSVVDILDPQTVQPGFVYLIIPDDELVAMIKLIHAAHLKTGLDLGIICFNDNQLKEVIEGGISAISTDFVRMGRIAAECIRDKRRIQEINPANLIVRASL